MALGSQFLTVPGVKGIADEGNKAIDKLLDEAYNSRNFEALIEDTKTRIKNLIEALAVQEQEVLKRLNCRSLEELNSKIQEFYTASGYQQFVGIDLKTITASFNTITDANKRKQQELYETLLYNVTREDVLALLRSQKIIDAAEDDIITILHKAISSFSGTQGVTWQSKFAHVGNGNSTIQIFAEEATKTFKSNVAKVQQQAKQSKNTKGLTKFDKAQITLARALLEPMKPNVKISNNMAQVNLGAKIAYKTGQLSPSDAKLLSAQELEELNAYTRNQIIAQLSPEYQPLAKKILKQMNKQDKYMFFLSNSSQQLEGILGEIAAVHAITHLLGPQYSSKALNWVATRKISGKQLSIDIILRDVGGIDIGIQVKNTEKNIGTQSLKISFANASIETVFNKLNIPTEGLEDVMTSDIFNVPFRRNGNSGYVQVSSDYRPDDPTEVPIFEQFIDVEATIDEISLWIRSYLLQYAPELLYMSLGTDIQNQVATLNQAVSNASGNLIYLVGNKVHFATEMLQNLRKRLDELQKIEQMKQQTIFSVTTYMPKLVKEDKNMTIVNYFNGAAGSTKKLSDYSAKLKATYKKF